MGHISVEYTNVRTTQTEWRVIYKERKQTPPMISDTLVNTQTDIDSHPNNFWVVYNTGLAELSWKLRLALYNIL